MDRRKMAKSLVETIRVKLRTYRGKSPQEKK